MKKACLLAVLSLSLAAAAHAQRTDAPAPKLSPSTRQYLAALTDDATTKTPRGWVYKQCNGQACVSALVQVADATAADAALERLGAHVGTRAGAVWTVQVPVGKVAAFTRTPGLRYIELDVPLVFPQMDDSARIKTHVDSVHSGVNLPMPYAGTGVVVGIMDFGFDYKHPLFWDTTGTRYRLRRVWEMGGTGTPPAPYGYGREIADTLVLKGSTTDNSKQTHGTQVAGMALGSGWGSPRNGRAFRGAAYDAEAILVGVRRDSIGGQWQQGGFSDFVDGISYMFKYAKSVGKPCVINVSWGSQSGPHDGSSLFNQAVDALTGPGALLVMSAGNDGRSHIHLRKTFTAADSSLATFLTFTPKNYQRTWIDAWGDAGKTWCVDAALYRNGVPTSATVSVCLDTGIRRRYLSSAPGDTCFLDFIGDTATYNGRPRGIVSVFNRTASDTLRLRYRATSGTVNLWNEYYYYGYDYGYAGAFSSLGQAGATEGDTIMTISDMGAGQSVLLVGAYTSSASWSDINGNGWMYPGAVSGALASFSSIGPYADGRIKPDITAPGQTVVTGLSSFDTSYTATGSNKAFVRSFCIFPSTGGKTYYYGQFQGTSASAPAASGIVALLLQAKPDLTPDSLRSLLAQTALQDGRTGVLPAAGVPNWGHGKINAYGALKRLAQVVVPPPPAGVTTTGSGAPDCTLFPNPGSGVLTLHHTGAGSELLVVQVYTTTGARLRSQLWPVSAGTSVLAFDARGLAAGVYLVRVQGSAGATVIQTVIE